MKVIGRLEEPFLKYEQEIVVVPLEELSVIEVQRKPSPYHIKRLMESMRKIGFVTPLIAIRRDDRIIVIDGQHRYLAARDLGIKELPCIIVPDKFAHDLMELNIEKQMTLREKAYVALNVYMMYLEQDGSIRESDGRIIDSIEFAYYVTLGLSYRKEQKLFGSAYESILRRVDNFLSLPLNEAMGVRERRAELVLEVDREARDAVARVEEVGISHPFLLREIISFCSPIGRKRIIDETFEEVFESLRLNIQRLKEEPERMRAYKFPEEALES